MGELEPKPLQNPERAARRHGGRDPDDEERQDGQRAVLECPRCNGQGRAEQLARSNPVRRLVDRYLQSTTPPDTLPRYSPRLPIADGCETEPRSVMSSRDASPAARRRKTVPAVAVDTARTTATDADGIDGGRPRSATPDPAARWMERMEGMLGPLFTAVEGDRLCVLVCTGRRLDDSRIVPVSFRVDADEEYRWQAVRDKMDECRGVNTWLGGWKRWLGRGEVELVDVRILGPSPTRDGELYGMARPVDIKGEIASLREAAERYGDIPRPSGPYGDDEPDHCFHDAVAGKVEHRSPCTWSDSAIDWEEGDSCGIEEQMGRLGRIERLEAAPLWSMALKHPKLAAGNSLLVKETVYSSGALHFDLRWNRRRGYADDVAGMKFRGYRVVWPEDRPEVAAAVRCFAAAAVLLVMVLGARVVHGDWGTAYTAGAFYVALAGVLSTWIGWSGATLTRSVSGNR